MFPLAFLPAKVLADCLEAALGACYSAGGISLAMAATAALKCAPRATLDAAGYMLRCRLHYNAVRITYQPIIRVTSLT